MMFARDRGWRGAASVLGIFAAVVALYWPAFITLGALWLDGARTTYTHGFLVAATSLWLVWRARAGIAAPDAAPLLGPLKWCAFLLLLAAALAWQIAYRAGLQSVAQVLLLPLLWLPVLLLLGRNAARATLLPVALLAFALPLWDVLTQPLQFATVQASRLALRTVGLPAYFDGNVVEIPDGTFVVEGGCSGLHYFITALFVGTLLGELRNDSWRGRVRWMVLGAMLALVVNWLRVASIIYIGHVTQMQSYLVRESHYGYGWALFAIAMVILFGIERRTALAPARGRTSVDSAVRHEPNSLAWGAGCAAIVALPMLLNLIVSMRLKDEVASQASAPLSRDWRESAPVPADWKPEQRNADRETLRRFESNGRFIDFFVAEYREQRLGKKLGGSGNRPQGDAVVLESGTLPRLPEFAYMIVDHHGERSVLLVTYAVAERRFASATRAQLWYSWLIFRQLSSPTSQMSSWRLACRPDCDQAHTTLVNFVAGIIQ